uniref:Uncharacterized protein n=1 Tax=Eutreptiella gymnastica TaxID=73025 RepID=A0A7S1HTF5_9EUGL
MPIPPPEQESGCYTHRNNRTRKQKHAFKQKPTGAHKQAAHLAGQPVGTIAWLHHHKTHSKKRQGSATQHTQAQRSVMPQLLGPISRHVCELGARKGGWGLRGGTLGIMSE